MTDVSSRGMDGAACRPGIVDRGPIGALGEEQRQQGRPGDDQAPPMAPAVSGATMAPSRGRLRTANAAAAPARSHRPRSDLIASERHQPRGKAGGEAIPP